MQQLTKIAHRIVGATAPDDRCLTDPAGNEPARRATGLVTRSRGVT